MFNVICTVSHIRSLFRNRKKKKRSAHAPQKWCTHHKQAHALFCHCCDLMQWDGRWKLNDSVFKKNKTTKIKQAALRRRYQCDNLQTVLELHEVLNGGAGVGGLAGRKSEKIREISQRRVIGRIFVWLSVWEKLVDSGGEKNNSLPSAS